MDFDQWWKTVWEPRYRAHHPKKIAQSAWESRPARSSGLTWADWLRLLLIVTLFAAIPHLRFEVSQRSPDRGTRLAVWWDETPLVQ
jgi:hypothetical protein